MASTGQRPDQCRWRHLQRSCYTGADNCTVSGNWAVSGGGIYNDHATLALDNCTVSDNHASWGGGGIHNRSGTLTITNSTLNGNWAAAPHSVGDGGAILNDAYDGNATLTVINSTFSGNQSYHFGGGIYNDGGATLTVNNSTFSDNYDFLGDAIFNLGR